MGKGKIGRNESCWCGSGIKYKKCHLLRDKQERVRPHAAEEKLHSHFSQKECVVPEDKKSECTGQIVKAHTVAKSWLRHITENGHLYGFKPSFASLSKTGGVIVPNKVGINEASTFNGFCGYHDNKLFTPIEQAAFNIGKYEASLLAYRIASREAYNKRAALRNLSDVKSLDRGMSKADQLILQSMVFQQELGIRAAISDSKLHMSNLEAALKDQIFDGIHAVSFTLDGVPPVMCAGGMNPEFDFDGNPLQDLADLEKVADMVTLTSFYDGQVGRIVFSWHESSHTTCKKLTDSLLSKPDIDLPKLLLQFMFASFENCFLRMSWWDDLSDSYKSEVSKLMSVGVGGEETSEGCLAKAYFDAPFPKVIAIENI